MPAPKENTICPKALIQMPKSNNDSQLGWKSSDNPIEAPCKNNKMATIIIVKTNNKGNNIFETLPNPDSGFLCEINQTKNQPKSIETPIIGMNVKGPLEIL